MSSASIFGSPSPPELAHGAVMSSQCANSFAAGVSTYMHLLEKEVAHDAVSGLARSSGGRPFANEKTEVTAHKKAPGNLGEVKLRCESLAPDACRANAQRVAKARWATWASRKIR